MCDGRFRGASAAQVAAQAGRRASAVAPSRTCIPSTHARRRRATTPIVDDWRRCVSTTCSYPVALRASRSALVPVACVVVAGVVAPVDRRTCSMESVASRARARAAARIFHACHADASSEQTQALASSCYFVRLRSFTCSLLSSSLGSARCHCHDDFTLRHTTFTHARHHLTPAAGATLARSLSLSCARTLARSWSLGAACDLVLLLLLLRFVPSTCGGDDDDDRRLNKLCFFISYPPSLSVPRALTVSVRGVRVALVDALTCCCWLLDA